VSENFGGSGGSYGDLLVVLYEHGFSSTSLPLAEHAIACQLLAEADPTGLHLRECLDGSLKITVASTYRFLSDGSVVLEAVPWAQAADAVLIVLPEDGGTVGLCILHETEVRQGRNLAGEDRSDVVLRSRSSIKAQGSSTSDRMLVLGAAARAAQTAGAARRAFEYSTEYASERRQFGKPIGTFQAVAHHLARMSGLCLGAESILLRLIDGGEPDRELVAAAKIWMGRTASDVARLAHQVHGAIGITSEHKLHRSTLRLRAWQGEYGSAQQWAEHLGTRVASDEEAWWVRSSPDRAPTSQIDEADR
jgi:acyl-CoA dehydrogenase